MNIPDSKFPDPRNFLGFIFWQKANDWERYINDLLMQWSINQTELFQLISLATLTREKPEVTQVDIVQFTNMQPMTTSKILKKLESKGLLSRSTGQDSRSKAIHITKKGWEVLVATAEVMLGAEKTFFPDDKRTQFKSYLQSLK